MQKQFIAILSCCLMVSLHSWAQTKHYQVEKHEGAERICFSLSATSGSWAVSPDKQQDKPVNIYCKLKDNKVQPEFSHKLQNGVCFTSLKVKDEEGLGKKLSQKMFGLGSDEEENQWKVLLSDKMPFELNLDYGMGDANINLSDIPVNRFKVKTASADVEVNYQKGMQNPVDMDTFQVEVELGSVAVKQLNLSRAQNIIADVGLGSLSLDFSDRMPMQSEVTANVGAGNLEILLPSKDFPVIVHIVNSPLCRVKLNEDFKEIKEHVFVNESYTPDAEDLLTFKVDVAMGKIVFKNKE